MAGVDVVVIFRQQVHVVQEDAAPVLVSEGLPHPDVQQLCPVESAVPPLKPQREGGERRGIQRKPNKDEHILKVALPPADLLHDVDAVVDLLPLQERVEVIEERTEVGLPIAVRHHYSSVVVGLTVWRPVPSPRQHQWVPLSDLIQGERRGEMDGHGSHWRKEWTPSKQKNRRRRRKPVMCYVFPSLPSSGEGSWHSLRGGPVAAAPTLEFRGRGGSAPR